MVLFEMPCLEALKAWIPAYEDGGFHKENRYVANVRIFSRVGQALIYPSNHMCRIFCLPKPMGLNETQVA
jgi:hypothetical protein